MGALEIREFELIVESVSFGGASLEGISGEIGVGGGGGDDVGVVGVLIPSNGSVSSAANTSYASSTEGKRGRGF